MRNAPSSWVNEAYTLGSSETSWEVILVRIWEANDLRNIFESDSFYHLSLQHVSRRRSELVSWALGYSTGVEVHNLRIL